MLRDLDKKRGITAEMESGIRPKKNFFQQNGVMAIILLPLLLLSVPIAYSTDSSSSIEILKSESLSISKKVQFYLDNRKDFTLDGLREDKLFSLIAVQQVKNIGYTMILDPHSGKILFHPRKDQVGLSLQQIKQSSPGIYELITRSISGNCSNESGRYSWLELDGRYSEKYADIRCIHSHSDSGVSLLLATTGYLDPLEADKYIRDYGLQDSTAYLKRHVKQKALEISYQLATYLEAFPNKTISDLKSDPVFSDLAVQPVAGDGYSVVFDYDSMVNIFHHTPEYVGIDYYKLKERSPGFWSIARQVIGGDSDAEGLYEWLEPDGQIRNKYMYISVIPRSTADGVGLAVSATAYLDDVPSDNAASPKLFTVEIGDEGADSGLLIYFFMLLGIVIYLFMIFSVFSDQLNGRVTLYFRLMVLFGLLMYVAYSIMVNTVDASLSTLLDRIVHVCAMIFIFFYSILCLLVAGRDLNKRLRIFLYFSLGILSLLMLTTPIVISGTYLGPGDHRIIHTSDGPFMLPFILLLGIMVCASFLSILLPDPNSKKNVRRSSAIFISMGILIAVNFIAYMYFHLENPLLLIISHTFFNVGIALAFVRMHLISFKQNGALLLIFLSVIGITMVFLINAHQLSSSIKDAALESYINQQYFITEGLARDIELDFEAVSLNLKITSRSVDAGLGCSEGASPQEIRKVYQSLSSYVDSVIVSDSEGRIVLMEPSTDAYPNIGHFSVSGNSADHPIKGIDSYASLFVAAPGIDAYMLHYPVYKGGILYSTISSMTLISTITGRHLHQNELEYGSRAFLLMKDRWFDSDGIDVQLAGDNVSGKVSGPGGYFKSSFAIGSDQAQDYIVTYADVDIPGDPVHILLAVPRHQVLLAISNRLNWIWYMSVGLILSIAAIGLLSNYLLTRSLRHQINKKTRDLKNLNRQLESIVRKRTRDLEELNKSLEQKVDLRTKQLNQKVIDQEKSKKAILNMMEDAEESNTKLREAREKLKNTIKELKKLDLQKSQFISIAAHELKTPLTSIRGFADLLRNQQVSGNPELRSKYLSIIFNDTRRLADLITNFLELSRMDLGILKMEYIQVDPSSLIKEVQDQMEVTIRSKGLQATFTAQKGLPKIHIDKDKMIQVISNLIINAVHYTEKGNIEVRADKKGSEVIFSVSDTGIGIPKDKFDIIFDRFYQVDNPLTRKINGTGLGLSLCKGFIEAMGGRIWVESELGKGSTFFFAIPTKKAKSRGKIHMFSNGGQANRVKEAAGTKK